MGEFLQNMYVWLWAALAILMIIVGIKDRHEHQGLSAVLMAVFFIFMTVWYGLRTFAGYPMFEVLLSKASSFHIPLRQVLPDNT